jgi:hypothetical protein
MEARVEVFWIPPAVEFDTPVTPENIEEEAFKIVLIRYEVQADQTIGLIKKSGQKVDSKRIRVKIKTDAKFYNFDSNGTGVSSTGDVVQVDLKKLRSVLCE